jgi:hypothetical protein
VTLVVKCPDLGNIALYVEDLGDIALYARPTPGMSIFSDADSYIGAHREYDLSHRSYR